MMVAHTPVPSWLFICCDLGHRIISEEDRTDSQGQQGSGEGLFSWQYRDKTSVSFIVYTSRSSFRVMKRLG
jgi:hypothetical protein